MSSYTKYQKKYYETHKEQRNKYWRERRKKLRELEVLFEKKGVKK